MKCKLCGGTLEKLGSLGGLVHLRCRNCGMWFNRKVSAKRLKKFVGVGSPVNLSKNESTY